MASNLTYKDFAQDEYLYFVNAYNTGMRFNAMVGQAQRICECYLKHVITKTLINNNEVMTQHNLRSIYEFMISKLNLPLQGIRADVMLLNNFYTHTRYPGRDAFLATEADVDAAFTALSNVVKGLQGYL